MAARGASKKSKPVKRPIPPVGGSRNQGKRTRLEPVLPPSGVRWASWVGFAIVVVLSITWVMTHAYLVDVVTVRLCEISDQGIPEEKRMPVFLSEIAFDGYMWNRHAEHLGEGGEWRLRHTDFDNAPEGREVHWNSAFAWVLRGLGEVYRAFTSDSLRNSIFRMSIWANPILLVLAIAIFSTLSARRFGPLCGSVIAIGMVAVPTFYEGFMPAYPDHHGLIAFTLLGLVFGIAWAGAGWVQVASGVDFVAPRSLRQARHGMIFSAICGAAGLWVSAFSTVVVLGAIGVGSLAALLFFGPSARRGGFDFHPDLWRLWARWGTAGGVFFYLLEYFPFHLGMRMEVNHPAFALGWLGGGTMIAVLGEWLVKRDNPCPPFPWRKCVWPVAACAVLPAILIFGWAAPYIPNDPFMWRLHRNIAELLPLMKRVELNSLTWGVAFGWFPLFVVGAAALLCVRRVGSVSKAVCVFLSGCILLLTAFQFYQVRWGMLGGPLYIALAGVVIPQLWRLVPRRAVFRVAAALLLLAFAFLFVQPAFSNTFSGVWSQFRSGDQIACTSGQALALIHRQMARAILDNAGGRPVVLLSSPNSSCILSAFGGFRTIGTLYWENVAGLKAAADGLNSQGEEAALRFIRKHGVTHLSFMTWENFIEPYFNILHPDRVAGISFDQSFGKRAFFDKSIPPWMRPIAFPPNALTHAAQQQILLLQFAPDQSFNEAKFHLARFSRFVEANPIQAEIALKEILDAAPESNAVNLELADLYLAQQRYRDAADQTLSAMKTLPPALRQQVASQIAAKLTAAGETGLAAEIETAAK